MPSGESKRSPLLDDPLLRDVPFVDGLKYLEPAHLTAKVGEGGWGSVYRGEHRVLGIDVAVKLIHPHLAAAVANANERFQREARLTAKLSHQNLVRLYEFRQAHTLAYLVLEYVDGETARNRVRRRGPLSELSAVRVVLAAARGLSVAHRHPEVIVHRDIKPDNILISRRGEVKLADLGLAKAMERVDGSTFATDGSVGTPRYMAPEQWNSDVRPTPRTDVWALGAVLYFLLVGEDMLRGTSVSEVCGEALRGKYPDPRERRPELSDEVARIVQRCTRMDPAGRPSDAVELARMLQELIAARSKPLAGARSWFARPPARRILLSAGLIGLTLLLLWSRFGLGARDGVGTGGSATTPQLGASVGVLDGRTRLRVPEEGWVVLESRPAFEDWAARVSEPRSGIEFMLLPPGRYLRGSPADEPGREDDETQHWVTLTRPFYIAVHETTNLHLERMRSADPGVEVRHPDLPLAVTRQEALRICREIDCDLPTEAEWEYAARVGSTSRYTWGDSSDDGAGACNVLDQSARGFYDGTTTNFFAFSDGYAELAPVGSFRPNRFGLHDMTGNLWEWCRDGYVESYEDLGELDPWNPSDESAMGVLRGGSWQSQPEGARVAKRLARPPNAQRDDFGFRVVKRLR